MEKGLYKITGGQEILLSLEDIKHIIRQMDIEDLEELDDTIDQVYQDDWNEQ